MNEQTDEQIKELREKVYNYYAVNKVLNSMEFSETFPHSKYLDEVELMKNVRARYNNNGRLLGIDYKKDCGKTFQKIIIRGKRPNEFEYGTDKNARTSIDEFKTKLESA